jgi:hypothetical protein
MDYAKRINSFPQFCKFINLFSPRLHPFSIFHSSMQQKRSSIKFLPAKLFQWIETVLNFGHSGNWIARHGAAEN